MSGLPPSLRFRVQLGDLVAVVIGYGLASVLFRAFWPKSGVSVLPGLFAVGFYLWLGLAMSGPILLIRRGPGSPGAPPRDSRDRPIISQTSRTWAEMAWLMIGVYWIVVGVFVLPVRLHDFRFSDTVLFGLVPILATLVLRLIGVRRTMSDGTRASWTHHVAVGLLASWPVAWFCLIMLGKLLL